ncbi:MAG: ATP-binding cassette domain-containing protein [Alphaproteobacteria bacterium]
MIRRADLLLLSIAAGWLFGSAAFGGDSFTLRLLATTGIFVLMVTGYQLVFGHGGALSLAQGTFFGLGAYVTALLAKHFGLPFLVTFPASIVGVGALAALIVIPVRRLESHYFALATLGIAQVVLVVATSWESLTGGSNGIGELPGIVIFGVELARGWPFLAVVWALALAGGWLAWQLTRGGYGLGLATLRDDAMAAEAAGIDVAGRKQSLFIASAMFGAAAGALFVHANRVVSPEAVDFHVMVTCLAMTVIGGRFRFAGAVIGAGLLVHLPEWFRFLEQHYLIAYGVALLVAIAIAPDGIVGAVERRLNRAPPPRAVDPMMTSITPYVRPGMDADPLLDVRAARKSYGGVVALADVSLQLKRGEILGLIGPNGSGKTTLINAITGFARIDAGGIHYGGRDIGRWPAWRIARLGLARSFQTAKLTQELTGLEIVAAARLQILGDSLGHALVMFGRDRRRAHADADADQLLRFLGADEAAHKRPARMTPFERKRVEIARALALEPDCLALDEPAAGLTESEQALLAKRLKVIAGNDIALLIVDHSMPFLARLADRFACLDAGALIAEGAPEAVMRHPAVIDAYLGNAGTGPAP